MTDKQPQTSLCDVHEDRLDDLENTVFGKNGEGLKTTMVEVRTTVNNLNHYVMTTLPQTLKEKFDGMQRTQNRIIGVLITVALLIVGGFVTAIYALLAK